MVSCQTRHFAQSHLQTRWRRSGCQYPQCTLSVQFAQEGLRARQHLRMARKLEQDPTLALHPGLCHRPRVPIRKHLPLQYLSRRLHQASSPIMAPRMAINSPHERHHLMRPKLQNEMRHNVGKERLEYSHPADHEAVRREDLVEVRLRAVTARAAREEYIRRTKTSLFQSASSASVPWM